MLADPGSSRDACLGVAARLLGRPRPRCAALDLPGTSEVAEASHSARKPLSTVVPHGQNPVTRWITQNIARLPME